ncbi:MAG: PqqD family protein [Solirubrobacterales bacterium]
MTDATPKTSTLLEARVAVPQHVVYRSFPSETVVLNLQTGKYHGLNPTAGRMLEALAKADSVRDAAQAAAREYEQPPESTEQDMCDLCTALLERGLIEIEGNGAL